ncbi:transmembrane protein 87A isoform X2 [Patella vulgata]|uniref:transmembrane protein 87A isoform X2 n=1 Tax=Patella vulgata TaxID=6465 RepID=UPI00217F4BDB|nr:transmembrane protein 87A isoform X2 [Patella vulgata]
MESMWVFVLVWSTTLMNVVVSRPEQGVWKQDYKLGKNEAKIHAFPRSLYTDTKVKVAIHCNDHTGSLDIKWIIRRSPCSNEYESVEYDNELQQFYMITPNKKAYEMNYNVVDFLKGIAVLRCEDHPSLIGNGKQYITEPMKSMEPNSSATKDVTQAPDVPTPLKSTPVLPKQNKRKRRATGTTAMQMITTNTSEIDYLAKAWVDGYYVFILQMTYNGSDTTAKVTVSFESKYGYISAVEWPLLVFFGLVGLLYIIIGLVWLVLLACNWRDLLRVQFWIGGVIVLGMLEAAVFFGEYENISKTGSSVDGAVILGEIVSSFKRTLARMLVIIVSLGFGIVKPRLGQTFHKVLCVGGIFFILSSVEGCMRALKKKSAPQKDSLLAAVPLAVVDAVICWWIFSALVQTTRTLRLRRNIVKLSLYRHFTNTLIFAVLASIAFMIWSITQHKLKVCLTDWKELWVDEAFWHMLFLLVLFIIMILWRPSTNNQRYAFSPLLDAAEDDEEENVMHDAFEGMKMRGTKSQANGSPKQKDNQYKVEDDLKWVEENIPSSVADKQSVLI